MKFIRKHTASLDSLSLQHGRQHTNFHTPRISISIHCLVSAGEIMHLRKERRIAHHTDATHGWARDRAIRERHCHIAGGSGALPRACVRVCRSSTVKRTAARTVRGISLPYPGPFVLHDGVEIGLHELEHKFNAALIHEHVAELPWAAAHVTSSSLSTLAASVNTHCRFDCGLDPRALATLAVRAGLFRWQCGLTGMM